MTKKVKWIFTVSGMHCAGCSGRVEKVLKALKGVRGCRADYAAGTVEVVCDPTLADPQFLAENIAFAGFTVTKMPGLPEADA